MDTIVETQRILTDDLLTFWADSFLYSVRSSSRSPGTQRFYAVKLGGFIAWLESQQVSTINQVTSNDIRRFLTWLLESGHTQGGCHAFYRAIRSFFHWLSDELDRPELARVISKVKAPSVSEEPLRPMGLDELTALVDTCDRDELGTRDKAILLTLYDTGLRASELLGLSIGDLDLSESCLTVRKSKSKRPRVVFFGVITRRALRGWLKYRGHAAGPIFTNRYGGPLMYDGLRAVITRRSKLAGIQAPQLHAFRRAFCLSQLQAHVPETAIARLMGHSNTSLIPRYARQSQGDLAELYTSPIDKNHSK